MHVDLQVPATDQHDHWEQHVNRPAVAVDHEDPAVDIEAPAVGIEMPAGYHENTHLDLGAADVGMPGGTHDWRPPRSSTILFSSRSHSAAPVCSAFGDADASRWFFVLQHA